MEAMGRLHDVIVNHHQYAQAWEEKLRIEGCHEQPSITETHISNRTCLFDRDILAQGLLNRYSYLNGIVLTHAYHCFQLMFHSWRLHISNLFKCKANFFLSLMS